MKRLLLAVMILGLTTGCSTEEDAANPCELLTVREASAVIGTRLQEALPTGTNLGCSYGNPNTDDTTVLVHQIENDSAADFAEDRELAAKTASVSDVEVGDQAFFYGTDGEIDSAEARLGSARYRVVIEGPAARLGSAVNALTMVIERARTPTPSGEPPPFSTQHKAPSLVDSPHE